MLKICKKCFYSSIHPLGITFDDEGVCSGCKVHEEKDSLDWESRSKKLDKILSSYKNSNPYYDCIIPVDGGKDSYFIVHTIKNIYGLKPLLVYFNKQYNTKQGIRNLQYLKTIFGCDTIENTINPEFAKKLVRYTLKRCGSIYWHNHLGSKTFPVQIAAKFKIPLIIWGVHQGIDQVGMFSHTDEVEMTRKYRKDHDLMGFEAEDIVDLEDDFKERYLAKLFYPTNKEISDVGIKGIYLNNYIRWDSKNFHESMIKLYDYETKKQTRTFIPYDRVDCFLYNDLHDYIKFKKFGYSSVTDHVVRELRLGKLKKDEAKALIINYQDIKPKYQEHFLRWIKMDEKEFNSYLDKYNAKAITQGPKDCKVTFDSSYIINNRKEILDDDFTLMYKGWIHE